MRGEVHDDISGVAQVEWKLEAEDGDGLGVAKWWKEAWAVVVVVYLRKDAAQSQRSTAQRSLPGPCLTSDLEPSLDGKSGGRHLLLARARDAWRGFTGDRGKG